MRQLLQHRLKTNIHGQTGSVQPRGNFVNTRGFQLQNQTLMAIAGWTGLEGCYVPTQANFAGNSALVRPITANSSINETTVSLWAYIPTGTSAQKIYDIGDPVAPGNETTRMRLSNLGVLDSLVANFVDGNAWDVMAVAIDMPFVPDTFNHIFMTARNGAAGGPSLDIWTNGVFYTSITVWTPDSTIDLRAGDQLVIGARHNLTQHFIGKLTDVWSASKYMDGATNVPLFYSPAIAADFPNGSPRPITKTVNGVTANNFLGGQGYTLSDWNNGVNNGNLGPLTLDGDPIT